MNRRTGLGGRIALLFLALIVCFAGLGVGYAHWTGNLYVNGTATTGTMCVGWYLWDPGDPGTDVDFVFNPLTGLPERALQHIGTGTIAPDPASLTCSCVVPPGSVPIPHYQTLVATIDNAYPYYYVDWELHVHNCGSLPVMIYEAVIDAPPELYVHMPDGQLPRKLHECEENVWSLIVYCRQPDDPNPGDPGVEPDTQYQFTVTIYYEQAQ